LLKQQAEIDIRPINYKGSAATVTDLSGGHIELAIETMAATLPHIKSGRIKAIAILSEQRSPLLPEVPTVAEQGFPGFVALGWAGLFVPNGTPLDVVDKIAADVNQVLSEPAVQEAIAKQGSVAENKSRSEWESFVTSETAKWTQAIKKGNIKVPE
jgi:tripartite-type tricarboxylate transporter receptor subunit TctC